MSTPENIKNKAYSAARQLVRNRLAESAGAEYEKLGPSDKMNVDRAVEEKQAHIKKIALKLIPQIANHEKKRMDSFHNGSPLTNYGSPEKDDMHEALNKKFASKIDTSKKKKEDVKGGKNPHIQMHNTFGEEVATDSAVYKAIVKKAEKSGVDINTLGEVYNRGMSVWYEDTNVSQQQYAFARVNSFINKGKSYFNEDNDLVSEATYQGKKVPLNKPMAGDVKKSKVYVDPDGDGKAQKVNFGDKTLSIKKNNPDRKKSYCARSGGQGNLNDKTSANYWSRKAWNCEEVDKTKPENREEGTDNLVKIYKKDTPGQSGNLNESVKIDAHRSGDTVWLNYFEVPKRGKGMGTHEYQKFEKNLPSDIKKVRLVAADAGHGPSHGFWDKMGFDYAHEDDDNQMVKKIRNKSSVSEDLNESFNMAFDYQGKPTLAPTAHDLMMKAQGGFAHHSDVQDVMNVTAMKEQIEKAFEATILEEDKNELAISMDNLIDMVNEAFTTIENIRSSNIERDAWSQAQILKLERYIQSVAAYINNMDETVRSGETHGVIVPAHTIVSQKTGQSISIRAKTKEVKKNDVVLHPNDNPFDGK